MQEPDPQVIRAAASGDDDAFVELVRAAQPHVWRFLLHLTGDRELAADLTQDTMVSVHRALPGFRGDARFSTWVLQIARNAATDAHRRRGRQERLAGRAAAQARRSTPDASTATEVRAAIMDLPDHLREAFVLVEVFGLRYREAATVLGVPEGTVKSRMFAARRALIDWLTAGRTEVAGG